MGTPHQRVIGIAAACCWGALLCSGISARPHHARTAAAATRISPEPTLIAVLETRIDTRRQHVGDLVLARVVSPRSEKPSRFDGARLRGRIVEIARAAEGAPRASVSVLFTAAELRSGSRVAVRGAIVGAPAPDDGQTAAAVPAAMPRNGARTQPTLWLDSSGTAFAITLQQTSGASLLASAHGQLLLNPGTPLIVAVHPVAPAGNELAQSRPGAVWAGQ
jgi:hypothetical protein